MCAADGCNRAMHVDALLQWGRGATTRPRRCVRRPHSSYKRVVQGKCPLHFLNLNGVVCSNTLFSNTSALTSSLLFRGNSTGKILEHLVWSNTSGFQFLGPLARTNYLSALCGLPSVSGISIDKYLGQAELDTRRMKLVGSVHSAQATRLCGSGGGGQKCSTSPCCYGTPWRPESRLLISIFPKQYPENLFGLF